MGTPTQYYVDPSIAGNSGSGTVGDPWGDLQYALDQITRDSTNGDQINIKAGTAEVLSASLTLATYGTPAGAAPLILRGYTSTADDGGRGDINCNTNTMWLSAAYDAIIMADLTIRNGASSGYLINLDNSIGLYNCRLIQQNSEHYGIHCDTVSVIAGCYFEDFGRQAILCDSGTIIYGCYIDQMGHANGVISADDSTVAHTIVSLDANGVGIFAYGTRSHVLNCTVYSSVANTGSGVRFNSDNGSCLNNYAEGFSGTGGEAYLVDNDCYLFGHNHYYNCTAGVNTTGDIAINIGTNSLLGASALTDPANEDFTVGTDLKAQGWPSSFLDASTNHYMDVGAAQREEAGGGLLTHPGMAGGCNA